MAWRWSVKLILDRLVNRFAARNFCQAGYGPYRVAAGPDDPVDIPGFNIICGARVDNRNVET
jgi:hypothetical protein